MQTIGGLDAFGVATSTVPGVRRRMMGVANRSARRAHREEGSANDKQGWLVRVLKSARQAPHLPWREPEPSIVLVIIDALRAQGGRGLVLESENDPL